MAGRQDGGRADMTTITKPAEIIQFQQKQEAQFVCSACGADRACDCNAPAVEKLAGKLEQDRQRARRAREKKALEKSKAASRDDDDEPSAADRAEARCAAKWKAFTAEEKREEKIGATNLRNAFLMNCAASREAANYMGENVDRELIAAAEGARDKWGATADKLERRHIKATGEHSMPTAEEAEESHQSALYDQAWLLVERMTEENRRAFLANLNDEAAPLVKSADHLAAVSRDSARWGVETKLQIENGEIKPTPALMKLVDEAAGSWFALKAALQSKLHVKGKDESGLK
jgi:hypothetical protein